MPPLRTLVGLFTGKSKASSRPALPTKNTFGVPFTLFTKGFQLFDHDIFDIIQAPAIDHPDIESIASLYGRFGCQVEDHLRDRKNTTLTTLNQRLRDDGAFCIYLEYKNTFQSHTGPQTIEWATLSIGTTEEGEQPQAHTSITCYLTPSPSGEGMLLVPQYTCCLGEKDGEPTYFAPETDLELTGSIAYTNETFLQLLAGLPLNPASNQKWAKMEEQGIINAAAERCFSMRCRTRETLEEDLTALLRKQTVAGIEKMSLSGVDYK